MFKTLFVVAICFLFSACSKPGKSEAMRLLQSRPVEMLTWVDSKITHHQPFENRSADPKFTGFKDLKEELQHEIDDLRQEIEIYKSTDPRFCLGLIDHDLDATEKDKERVGSFTDYFVLNGVCALKAGAKRSEVDARMGRVIALAKKGKFMSSALTEFFQGEKKDFEPARQFGQVSYCSSFGTKTRIWPVNERGARSVSV